jgi:hypothetical protein
MKTLALYVRPAQTRINLKLAPNDHVLTCIVFVRQWNQGVGSSVATWFPAEFESPQGSSIILQPSDGYDFIVKAEITGPPDAAAMDARFSIDGAVVYSKTVPLPSAEGAVIEREWSVIIP